MSALRFGIALSTQHRPDEPSERRFREHLEQVRLARSLGFDTVAATQHYLAQPFTYLQPIPVLARIAAEAEGMTLATGIVILPLCQPLELAEQLATLDVICGGRFVFGAGLGYRDAENEAFGLDPRKRVSRFVEALDVVQKLWSGEPVTHEGRHFRLRDVQISIRPLQKPRPPIWLAANGDNGVTRAARLGDAWIMNPHTSLDTLERQVALFHATRVEQGCPPAAAMPLGRECYVAPSDREALAEGRAFLERKYEAYRQWGQDEALPDGETFDLAIDDLAKNRFVLGDPARVRDEIARYRERLGLTHIVFRLQWPGIERERVLRSIRLLGEKVLPYFA